MPGLPEVKPAKPTVFPLPYGRGSEESFDFAEPRVNQRDFRI